MSGAGSSGRSSSSSSEDSEAGGHPMDVVVSRRAAAAAAGGPLARPGSGDTAARPDRQPSSGTSPESGELAIGGRLSNSSLDAKLGAHGDLDAVLASARYSSESSSGSEDPGEEEPAELALTGVILVENAEERNAEVARLLRAPRYFDEDFEEAGMRCFKCGGKGHMARNCTAEAKERSCFLCAQFGHDSRDCPNSLCWRCQRPGHMARDCPYSYRQQASWDEASVPVCLRCGSESCPCAGEKDFVRAEGGCKREYSHHDVQRVHCYSCGKRGHLSCTAAPAQPPKLSCSNCGQGGHTAGECSREAPQVMRGERMGMRPTAQTYRGGGYGAADSGSYGSRGRFASYAAEIEQPDYTRYDDYHRGRSVDYTQSKRSRR